MYSNRKKGILFVRFLGMLALFFAFSMENVQGAISTPKLPLNTKTEQLEGTNVYLPISVRNNPRAETRFGVEMASLANNANLDLARSANVYWLRNAPLFWNLIEPARTDPPTYKWETAEEVGLIQAAQRDMHVIATVRFTPDWARKVNWSAPCGPIKQEAFAAFAEFLSAAVTRYSRPPYNVKYWELGNEPDVPVTDQSIPYGCWGDWGDDYFGGGHYGEMLKFAYPAIKAADSQAQVLIGGLLLDCDPENPPPGKDCKPAKFLEGILKNGGGDFFDIVSFHGYPQYDGQLPLDENFPSWNARGGVVLGKVNFLRQIMADFGVDKPLMHTEGALICPETNPACTPPGADFFQIQADYVVWLYVRNWAAGVKATFWYPFEGPGWRNAGLLDVSQNPRPAYYAYKFLTQELNGAEYVGQVSQYPGLRSHEFRAPGKRIWVLWSPDAQTRTISLPSGVLRALDRDGNLITPVNNQITVKSPRYIELAP